MIEDCRCDGVGCLEYERSEMGNGEILRSLEALFYDGLSTHQD